MLHTTGMPIIDARDDFLRARRAHKASRLLGAPRRRARAPRTLPDAKALPRDAARLQVIPLDEIVGTLEPTRDFDARFRPASEHVRSRWERVALAYRKGVGLPPITVLRGDDGYYVVDGRHRVSVSRAMGLGDIEAWVTEVGAPRRAERCVTRRACAAAA